MGIGFLWNSCENTTIQTVEVKTLPLQMLYVLLGILLWNWQVATIHDNNTWMSNSQHLLINALASTLSLKKVMVYRANNKFIIKIYFTIYLILGNMPEYFICSYVYTLI